MSGMYNFILENARSFASIDNIFCKIVSLILCLVDIAYGLAIFMLPFNVWRIARGLEIESEIKEEEGNDRGKEDGNRLV